MVASGLDIFRRRKMGGWSGLVGIRIVDGVVVAFLLDP